MAIAVQLVACFSVAADGFGGQNRRRQRGECGEARRLPQLVASEAHFSASRLTFSDRSSNSLLARCT